MEKMFSMSRYLVLVVVVTCLVGAVLLYFSSIVIVFQVVVDVFSDIPANADSGKRLAVRLLKVLDVLLIAVTFQIIAIGLFRLFISRSPAEIERRQREVVKEHGFELVDHNLVLYVKKRNA